MRYNVNEKLVFISFDYEMMKKDGSFEKIKWVHFSNPEYIDKVNAVRVVELKVVEHHKVYWRYDDRSADPTNDGYVLVDKDNERWYNQYPLADYGQISDTGDAIAMYHPAEWDKEGFVYDRSKVPDDKSSVFLASRWLDEVSDSIRMAKQDFEACAGKKSWIPEYINQKLAQKKMVIDAIRSAGYKITVEPHLDLPELTSHKIIKE